MTAAKLDSIQAECKEMQSTCRAGTGVHTCWEDSCDSHPSVVWPLRHKREQCSPFHTASRGGKQKKVKASTAEESKPIDWTWTCTAN